jgi:hypothetical protein
MPLGIPGDVLDQNPAAMRFAAVGRHMQGSWRAAREGGQGRSLRGGRASRLLHEPDLQVPVRSPLSSDHFAWNENKKEADSCQTLRRSQGKNSFQPTVFSRGRAGRSLYHPWRSSTQLAGVLRGRDPNPALWAQVGRSRLFSGTQGVQKSVGRPSNPALDHYTRNGDTSSNLHTSMRSSALWSVFRVNIHLVRGLKCSC